MASAVGKHPCLNGPNIGSYTLTDGETFGIRFGRPDDRKALLDGFELLSPESRYFRFFSAMPKLTSSMVDSLSDVDRFNRVAVVAYPIDQPDKLVGVVRFYRNVVRSDEADLALTVIDSYQGRGLGTLLYERCAAVARANGISLFTAQVLSENRAMLDFFSRYGAQIRRDPSDATTIFVRIPL